MMCSSGLLNCSNALEAFHLVLLLGSETLQTSFCTSNRIFFLSEVVAATDVTCRCFLKLAMGCWCIVVYAEIHNKKLVWKI